jgi:hypothetical protein
LKVEIKAIKGKSREANIVAARWIFANILDHRGTFLFETQSNAGRYICKNHATINHYLKNFQNKVKRCYSFRKLIQKHFDYLIK